MPYIQITDASGYTRQISSSDNETVGRWLVETLSLFTNPNPAYGIRINVLPLWVGPETGGAWDWPPATNQVFTAELNARTPIENIRALAQTMEGYADKLERSDG